MTDVMFNFRFGRRLAMNEETYDFPPFRPPSEADSLLVRVTRGCPWNRCAFCPMYKDVKFEKRTVEAVKRDMDTAKAFTGGCVKTVFIGDSDSLVIRTQEMCDILKHLHETFPSLARVTSYARALTLKRKPSQDLAGIRSAGLTRLHLGLETGSRELLKKIRKGADPETMIAGATRAKEAGFEVSLYVLLGIGGASGWRRHAQETARVINTIDPHFIRIRTLTPQPGTPVYDWWKDGTFEMPDPETILKEQRGLIQGLSVTSRYLSDHVSNYAPIHGQFPDDKEEMIAGIDSALAQLEKDADFRAGLERMVRRRRL